MDDLGFSFDWELILACERCGMLFCTGCTEPLSVQLPNGWRVVLANDFCSRCSLEVSQAILDRFVASTSGQGR
jgi:hypothetical protein